MSLALDRTRQLDVLEQEKHIKYGGDVRAWKDIEAGEVDLRGGLTQETYKSRTGEVQAGHATRPEDEQFRWEQWGGLIQRGKRKSLLLTRLRPSMTKQTSPGPGAIRAAEWEPLAKKHLAGKYVILHTDGARSYKLAVSGRLHDHVVHQKKQLVNNGKVVKKKGKVVWVRPQYTKVFSHTLPNGRKLKCKGDTQIIDRFWRFLRAFFIGRNSRVGSAALNARVRSAQWAYWS